eukprot:gene11647-biopygen12428
MDWAIWVPESVKWLPEWVPECFALWEGMASAQPPAANTGSSSDRLTPPPLPPPLPTSHATASLTRRTALDGAVQIPGPRTGAAW